MEETVLKPHVVRRRLLKLADFLEKLPRSKFDYLVWGECDVDKVAKVTSLAQPGCGTRGCALGWAASMPEFRRLGLALCDGDMVYGGKVGLDVTFNGAPSTGSEVFGLRAAEHCFMPDIDKNEGRATPKRVAKKIRKYVADVLPTRDELRASRGPKPARKKGLVPFAKKSKEDPR
jgi:hypothetical protein